MLERQFLSDRFLFAINTAQLVQDRQFFTNTSTLVFLLTSQTWMKYNQLEKYQLSQLPSTLFQIKEKSITKKQQNF